MTRERNVLADRLSGFLKTQFSGPCRDQELARLINAHPRTARNYFNGYWPGARQWRAIVRQFGRDVITAVFGPEINEVEARFDAEIRELEERLHARMADRRSFIENHSAGVASDEGRS